MKLSCGRTTSTGGASSWPRSEGCRAPSCRCCDRLRTHLQPDEGERALPTQGGDRLLASRQPDNEAARGVRALVGPPRDDWSEVGGPPCYPLGGRSLRPRRDVAHRRPWTARFLGSQHRGIPGRQTQASRPMATRLRLDPPTRSQSAAPIQRLRPQRCERSCSSRPAARQSEVREEGGS